VVLTLILTPIISQDGAKQVGGIINVLQISSAPNLLICLELVVVYIKEVTIQSGTSFVT